MRASGIALIELLEDRLRQLDASHKEAVAETYEKLAAIRGTCDHKRSDGSSAIEGTIFLSHCLICGKSDL